MKIAKTIEYAATPEEVFAVSVGREVPGGQVRRHGCHQALGNRRDVGDHTVITTERILPSDGLPDFAKSMVGDDPQGHRDPGLGPGHRPTAAVSGTVEMAVAGAPIALKGTAGARARRRRAPRALDAELKAKVPADRRQDREGRRAAHRGGHRHRGARPRRSGSHR